jgi:hypothetical protein
LGLNTQLVLETSGEVVDVTLSISRDVGNLADLVEHVTSSTGQDHDDGKRGPDVAVLNNRQNIWPDLGANSHSSEHGNSGSYPQNVVDRTLDGWLRSVRHVAGDPVVDLLCNLGSWQCQYINEFRQFCHGKLTRL